jgi:hypothetical protein
MVASPCSQEKLMLLSLLLTLCAAQALQPPVGWTLLGPDRAVMVPSDPGRGEVRELPVAGGTLEPDALVQTLAARGEQAVITDRAADGTVSLKLSADRQARGRAHITDGQVTWYLVVASNRAAGNLDADALLTALIPRELPAALQGQVEVMPAGRDGSLWDPVGGTQGAQTSQSTGLWGVAETSQPSTWGKRSALVGIWGGIVGGPWGGGVEYVFTFDATGRVRIDERGPDGNKVTEGTWEASGDRVRVSSFTADPVELPYRFEGQALVVTWGGQHLTLFVR